MNADYGSQEWWGQGTPQIQYEVVNLITSLRSGLPDCEYTLGSSMIT